MEFLYLILERKILLLYYCGMHRCLIIFIFWKFRDCFYLFASLANAISGRAEIDEWQLDTDMMMCKNQAMLIYLVMTSLIFAGSSAQCFLPYAWCYLAIAQSFRLSCRCLNANFTWDGPRGYIAIWHDWWTFLRGRMGNVTESVKRSILSIVENYATAIYLFVCLIGIYKTRIVLAWWIICYGRYKQL